MNVRDVLLVPLMLRQIETLKQTRTEINRIRENEKSGIGKAVQLAEEWLMPQDWNELHIIILDGSKFVEKVVYRKIVVDEFFVTLLCKCSPSAKLSSTSKNCTALRGCRLPSFSFSNLRYRLISL